MKQRKSIGKFVLCIRNEGCEDLELRKLYRVLPDKSAAGDGYIRVIDESGEDYLYPEDCFSPIELPKAAEKSLLSPPKMAQPPKPGLGASSPVSGFYSSCVGEPVKRSVMR